MTINGINGANTQMGQMGMNQAADSYSKNIQNQIANAQKQLQELSSNEDMSLEEKMKKRQEIQKKISDLNAQLRQHQIEQRRAAMSGKEKQQAEGSSMDDMLGSTRNDGSTKAGNNGTGLSQASMTAMISADGSIKQAKIQGSVAASMEGSARVLKAEIQNSHGGSVEKKQEELADIEQKAQAATISQMYTLADASKTMEKAAQADSTTEKTAGSSVKEEKAQGKVAETDAQTKKAENVQTENGTQEKVTEPVETSASEAMESQTAVHTRVDVRL